MHFNYMERFFNTPIDDDTPEEERPRRRLQDLTWKSLPDFYEDISHLNLFTHYVLEVVTNPWVFRVRPQDEIPKPKKATIIPLHITKLTKDSRWNRKLQVATFNTAGVLEMLQDLTTKGFDSRFQMDTLNSNFKTINFYWTEKGMWLCDKDMNSYPIEIFVKHIKL